MTLRIPATFIASAACSTLLVAQTAGQPDWKAVEEETMRHYQSLVRIDTTAKELPAAAYLKKVLDDNGIPAQMLSLEPDRPNVLARLKGNGKKRPLLIMGHTDTVSVDAAKWTFPPFSATRDGGYIYGRGTIDDKDNATAGADDDAAAEAARSAARPRRHLPGRIRRGREFARRYRLHGQSALPRDRCRVLSGRRRQHRANWRRGEVREGSDARESPARHRARRARHFRSRIDPAQVERHRAPGRRRREGGRMAAGYQVERDDRHLLPPAGLGIAARGCEVLPRHPLDRSQGARGGGRLALRERTVALVDAPDVGVAEHLSGRLPVERDSVGSEGHARRPHAAGRGRRRLPRPGQTGRQRSGRRGSIHLAGSPAVRHDRAARRGSVQGARSRHHQGLQHDHAADDEHGCDGHGAAAREGRAMLRHRPGRRTWKTAPRASARTAIRNVFSRANCTGSCASTGRSSPTSPERGSSGAGKG